MKTSCCLVCVSMLVAVMFTGCGLNGDNGDPWALVREYAIGDEGPAGGVIFYDKGERSDGWRYLEVVREGVFGEYYLWRPVAINFEIGTGLVIGTGEENTAAIVTHYGPGEYAAYIASDFAVSGFDDWFLPSAAELNEFMSVSGQLGLVLEGVEYWSSSENYPEGFEDSSAIWQAPEQIQEGAGKESNGPIVPIRAF